MPKMHAHSVVSVLSISPEETSTGQMAALAILEIGHFENFVSVSPTPSLR